MTTVVACAWGIGIRTGGDVHQYVRRLYRGIVKHSTLPFRFVLFTDERNHRDYGPGVEVRRMTMLDDGKTCLPKLFVHSREAKLSGRVLLMDLDTIIAGSMDPMLAWRGKFISRAEEKSLAEGTPMSGGNMQSFEAGTTRYLWETYRDQHARCMAYPWEGCERRIIRAMVTEQTFWRVEIPDSVAHVRRDLQGYSSKAVHNGQSCIIATGSLRPHRLPAGPIRSEWEACDRVLRLNLVPHSLPRNRNQLEPFYEPGFLKHLADAGVLIVDRDQDADLVQAFCNEKNEQCDVRGIDSKPVIIIEKVDGTHTAQGLAHLASDKRVIGWMKGYTAALDPSMIRARPHVMLLLGGKIVHGDPTNEIEHLWGFIRMKECRAFVGRDPELLRPREIDVSFIGRTNFKSHFAAPIEGHRKACVKAINALGLNVDVELRKIPHKQYVERTLRAKVVISPWGWGEPCIRDYEALLAGCILIKPDTPWIRGMTDIDPFTVKCSHDWSDLPERVAEAMNLFSNVEHRRAARERCMIEWDDRVLAQMIAGRLWRIARRAGIAGTLNAKDGRQLAARRGRNPRKDSRERYYRERLTRGIRRPGGFGHG